MRSPDSREERLAFLAAHLGVHIERADSLIVGLRDALNEGKDPDGLPDTALWREVNELCEAAERALKRWDKRTEELRRRIRQLETPPSSQ